MFRNLRRNKSQDSNLAASQLFDNATFYDGFIKDLSRSKKEVIIESPFLTTRRVSMILPALAKLKRHGLKIIVNTRDPLEQEGHMQREAELSIDLLQGAGVSILFTGGHHRKLAIIDREILWEGSLNILSQNDSCEVMRRIESEQLAAQMISFIKLDKHLEIAA
ncbi:MAG TPA: phospholipase D-like domain-containing protein [Candidatus Saccharimonadales bacterium]|nr:phospholipase D-like domain-containing protein [Candidatus Saccharimonadales bacterium]